MHITLLFMSAFYVLSLFNFLYSMEASSTSGKKPHQKVITADGKKFSLKIAAFGVLQQCVQVDGTSEENAEDYYLELPIVQACDLEALIQWIKNKRAYRKHCSLDQKISALRAADALDYKKQKMIKNLIGSVNDTVVNTMSEEQAKEHILLLEKIDGSPLSSLIETDYLKKKLIPTLLPTALYNNQQVPLTRTQLNLSDYSTSQFLGNPDFPGMTELNGIHFSLQSGSFKKQAVYAISEHGIKDFFTWNQQKKLVCWHPANSKWFAVKSSFTKVMIYRLKQGIHYSRKESYTIKHKLLHAEEVRDISWHSTSTQHIAVILKNSVVPWLAHKNGLLEKLSIFSCSHNFIQQAVWHSNLKTLAAVAGAMIYIFDCSSTTISVGNPIKDQSRNIRYFLPHKLIVVRVAWDPFNVNRIASSSLQKAYVWNLKSDGSVECTHAIPYVSWPQDFSWHPLQPDCLMNTFFKINKAQITFLKEKGCTRLMVHHQNLKKLPSDNESGSKIDQAVNSLWHPTNKNCFATMCYNNVRIWYILDKKKISCIAQIKLDYEPYVIGWSLLGTMLGVKNAEYATLIHLSASDLLQKIDAIPLSQKCQKFYEVQGIFNLEK